MQTKKETPDQPSSCASEETRRADPLEREHWHPTHRLGSLGCLACGCGGRHPDHAKQCPAAPRSEIDILRATLEERTRERESWKRQYDDVLLTWTDALARLRVAEATLTAARELLEAAKWAAMEWRLHGQLTDSCRVLEAAIRKSDAEAALTASPAKEDAITNVAAFVDGWLVRELEDLHVRSNAEIRSSLTGLREAIAPYIVGSPAVTKGEA